MEKGAGRIHIETLGCKLNHYESLGIAAACRCRGFGAGALEEAEIIVINSCAVTAEAVRQSLQLVCRALRRHPRARIFLV